MLLPISDFGHPVFCLSTVGLLFLNLLILHTKTSLQNLTLVGFQKYSGIFLPESSVRHNLVCKILHKYPSVSLHQNDNSDK